MESYQEEYNKLLERYYNGCKYLEQHRDEIDRHLDLLLEIQNNLNKILEKNKITDTNIILNGF